VLSSNRRLSWLHWRILWQRALMVASLLCFLASLPAPAVVVDMGSSSRRDQQPLPGWLCLVFPTWFYVGNFLLITAPAWLAYLTRLRRRWPQVVFAAVVTISTTMVLAAAASMLELFVGYYLWAAAHLLATVAASIPVWLPRQGIGAERPANAPAPR
jgi:hypothetical protein